MVRDRILNEPLFYNTAEIAVPKENSLYVRLDAALRGRWKELAEPLRGAFAERMGRPVDPVVYVKVFLVGFLENITYDTDLAERIDDSKAIRYFLGYDLSEATPDHSSISRVRGKMGSLGKVREVLSKTVELCSEEGLVFGELVAVDSTLVGANASLRSLRHVHTGQSVREYLKEVEEANRELSRPRWKKPKVSNKEFGSRTDPDSRVAGRRGGARKLCYKWTHVTTGKVTVASCASPADVGDARAGGMALLEAARTLGVLGQGLGVVLGDSGYDDSKFHAQVEGLGGTPLTNVQRDTSGKAEGFGKASFVYDRERDVYVCPNGFELRRRGVKGRAHYVADAVECANCPDRSKCLSKGAKRRTVTRGADEASRERVMALLATRLGGELVGERKGMAEHEFGRAKAYGGLSKVSCRGLGKAEMKVVFGSCAANLVTYMRTKLRRHTAEGRAGQRRRLRVAWLAGLGAAVGLRVATWRGLTRILARAPVRLTPLGSGAPG